MPTTLTLHGSFNCLVESYRMVFRWTVLVQENYKYCILALHGVNQRFDAAANRQRGHKSLSNNILLTSQIANSLRKHRSGH